MALIHAKSPPCAIEQLELFEPLATCIQVERSAAVPHYSISSLDGSTNILEFVMQGSGDQYVDLSRTKLYLKCRIMRSDGTNLPANVEVGPCNNFLATLFSQCDIFLNDKMVTSSNNLYPFRAYFEQILNYSQATSQKQLTAQMFYLDSPSYHNSSSANNTGFASRKNLATRSRVMEMMGPLFADVMSQGNYLVNNVDVRVRLSRSTDTFCLMDFGTPAAGAVAAVAGNAKVVIDTAILYFHKVSLNPSAQLGIESMLREKNAIYNMQRHDLKSFTIPGGSTTFTREHISLGLSPKYAIIGLLDTAAVQGNYEMNPFLFEGAGVKQISLNVDGMQVPMNGINVDFTNSNCIEGYQSLIEVIGKYRVDQPFMFSYTDYMKGNALYGFQLAPEIIPGAFNLVHNANIRLDIKFANATTKNLTVLICFAYDSAMEVNQNREIFYDFST